MLINTERRGNIRILSCEGALTIGLSADSFEQAVETAIGTGGGGLVLDFSRVRYLDSAGVGSVVSCAKKGGERGTVVKIVIARGSAMERIFQVTQLELAFEVFHDVGSALASFP